MNFKDKFGDEPGRLEEQAGVKGRSVGPDRDLELEPELDETLSNFRLSVHAWSDSVLSRPRKAMVVEPHRRVWRLAAGWALGCALVVGSVSAGVYEQHRRQELARIAAAQAAEQRERQRLAAEQSARLEDEELLAKVDRDVSRQVPAAMEPLAQLMTGEETR